MPLRRLLSPTALALAAGALAAAVLAALFLLPAGGAYLFLPDEPHPVEPLIRVPDPRPDRDGGAILFVDVVVRRPSLLERLWPGLFHDGASLVPEHAVNPTGLPDEERRRASLRIMERSQEVAAAAPPQAAGHHREARPRGAFVAQVLPESAAAGRLRPGDVIVGVDGRQVRTVSDLRAALLGKLPGARVALVVRRDGKRRRLALRLGADPDDPGRGVIGVLVEPAVDVRLPVEVDIRTPGVGGPSAGLAFALGLLERLGRDVDRGHRVAVTGTLDLAGEVGAVGGIRQKTIGAREGGADVFLVPAGDNAAEARRYADGLRIVPVRSFQQALHALATLPRKEQDR